MNKTTEDTLIIMYSKVVSQYKMSDAEFAYHKSVMQFIRHEPDDAIKDLTIEQHYYWLKGLLNE